MALPAAALKYKMYTVNCSVPQKLVPGPQLSVEFLGAAAPDQLGCKPRLANKVVYDTTTTTTTSNSGQGSPLSPHRNNFSLKLK